MTNELEPDMDNWDPFQEEEWEFIDPEPSYIENEDDNLPWDSDD